MAVSELSAELINVIVDILHENRIALDLSKKKLAAEAGVSRTAIILMEAHKRAPSLGLVIRLSMSMGVPLSRIITKAEKRLADKLKRGK